MELKDFIRQTLLEIGEGVHEANDAFRESRQVTHNAFYLSPTYDKDKRTGIDFDVAVTSREEMGAKGGVKVLAIGAGVEGQQISESVSRIRFTVGISNMIG